VFGHDETASEFYGAEMAWNGDGWTLDFRDGRQFLFPEAYHAKNYAQGAAFEIRDAKGHRLTLRRDNQRKLEQVVSPPVGQSLSSTMAPIESAAQSTTWGNSENTPMIPPDIWKA
jgi:hypothetical protein